MAFPPIPKPDIRPAALLQYLQAIYDSLTIGLGRGRNQDQRDRWATMRDLGETNTTVQQVSSGASSALAAHVLATGINVHGLGDAATKYVGTAPGTVSAGDHAHDGAYEPAGAVATHLDAANPHAQYALIDEAITVPEYIPADTTVTIGPRRQLIVYNRMEIKGKVNIEAGGRLVVL